MGALSSGLEIRPPPPLISFSRVDSLSLLSMAIPAEHLVIRELKTWRSYGIDGNGPTVDTLIKDIGDDHLLNIIRHLEERYPEGDRISLPTVWEMMHDEILWRMQGCWVSIL